MTPTRWRFLSFIVLCLLASAAHGCGPSAGPTPHVTEHGQEHEYSVDEMPAVSAVSLSEGEKLRVVATTSIVADVVHNVGGDKIGLTALMPRGTDPHAFEPTPRDVATVADAHVVFINGVGLEVFIERLLQSAGEGVTVVPVSYGVELLKFEGAGEHGGFDPHTWFDPRNVMVWADNVEHTLSTLDPNNSGAYVENAKAYKAQLEQLHDWIRDQLSEVPADRRQLVSDHAAFGYFAHRYGFEQIGAVFPGYSTLAEPSAQDIAVLEDAIREFDAKAVFVGLTVNPSLAERVAEDTGTELVLLYTGSLSEPGGLAADYMSLMHYDVAAIVEALR